MASCQRNVCRIFRKGKGIVHYGGLFLAKARIENEWINEIIKRNWQETTEYMIIKYMGERRIKQ